MTTPQVEAEHVHRVYDSIAAHFSHTRHHPWPLVTDFLLSQPSGSLVADVGCGNGKYLAVNPSLCVVGADRSVPLLQAGVGDRRLNVLGGDALNLPLRTRAFDAAICIAVLHHISTVERRLALLGELARVVRVGGQVLVVAWAFEQDARSKRKFEQQDVMVEWKLQEKYASDNQSADHARKDDAKRWVVYERYCHVYREGELENLVELTPGLQVVRVEYSRSNWFSWLVLKHQRAASELRSGMIDDNRDDPSSGNEKHVLVDGDSSEDEQNEIEDGSDTARIAQSVTDFSRRCLQTGAYSKALIALQNAVEIAEMPSLAYRQAVFQTAQVLKASRAFQSSIECMLIIYHNMPTPYNRRDGVIIVARLYEELGDARAAAFWVKKAAISDSLASIYQVLGDLAFEHQDYVFAADFYAQSIDRNHSDPVNSIRTVYRLLFSLGQFTSPCIALHRHQRQLLAWRLVREFQFNRYLYAETDFWKLRNLCEGSFPSIYRAIFLWEEEYGKRIARWWKRLRSPQPKFSEYAEEDERLDKERASPISMKKSKTRQRPNLKKNVRNPYEDPAPLPRKPPVPRQSSPKRLAQSKQNQESSPPKHTESTVGENDVPKGKNDQKAQNSKPTAAEYEPSPTKRKLSAVRRLRRRQLDDDVRSPRPALPFTGSEPTLITTSDVPDNLLEIYPLQLPSIDEFLLAHGRHPGMAELDIRQVEEFARIAHYRARVIATKHLSVASLTSERVKPHWLQDLDKAVVMLTSFQRSRQRLDEDSIVHLAEIHARLVFQLENVYHQYFKEYGTTAFGIELQSLISQLSAWGFDTIGNVMDALKCVVQLAVEDEKQRNLEFYHVHRLPGDIGEKLTRGTAEK